MPFLPIVTALPSGVVAIIEESYFMIMRPHRRISGPSDARGKILNQEVSMLGNSQH